MIIGVNNPHHYQSLLPSPGMWSFTEEQQKVIARNTNNRRDLHQVIQNFNDPSPDSEPLVQQHATPQPDVVSERRKTNPDYAIIEHTEYSTIPEEANTLYLVDPPATGRQKFPRAPSSCYNWRSPTCSGSNQQER